MKTEIENSMRILLESNRTGFEEDHMNLHPRQAPWTNLLFAGALALGCSGGSGNDIASDLAIDATDALTSEILPDAYDEGQSEAGIDAPQGCSFPALDACPDGFLCIQSQPPYCSTDFIGGCQPVPSECPVAEGSPVCHCGDPGIRWASECEARRAGYGGRLGPCGD